MAFKAGAGLACSTFGRGLAYNTMYPVGRTCCSLEIAYIDDDGGPLSFCRRPKRTACRLMQRVMGNIPSTPRWSQERTPASSCQTWLCVLASPAPTLDPSWEIGYQIGVAVHRLTLSSKKRRLDVTSRINSLTFASVVIHQFPDTVPYA